MSKTARLPEPGTEPGIQLPPTPHALVEPVHTHSVTTPVYVRTRLLPLSERLNVPVGVKPKLTGVRMYPVGSKPPIPPAAEAMIQL